MFSIFFKNCKYYFLGGLLSYAITWYLLDLSNFKFHVPLTYIYDELFYDFIGKTLVDNPWFLTNKFTGAPGLTELFDFPISGDNFHLLLIKVLAIITGNGIVAVNLFYILGYPLTTLISIYVMRNMGVNALVSICFSLLFTFIPCHFFRGTGHLLLSSYYLLPLGVLMCFWIATDKNLLFDGSFFTRNSWKIGYKRTLLFFFFVILTGGGSSYYAFFIIIILFTTGIYAATSFQNFQPLVKSFIGISLVFGMLMINLSPTISERISKGRNYSVADRIPVESELYALRLTQMVLPVDDHRYTKFSNFKLKYNNTTVLKNENTWSSLGLISSLGLAFLIFWLISKRKNSDSMPYSELLTLLSIWLIISFLYGTMGGLGALFSYLIDPTIRSLNRISILIAFFSLTALACLTSQLFEKIKDEGYKILILLTVLFIGVYDQTTDNFKINQNKILSDFKSDSAFVSEIESLVPSGQIFQLPHVQFPEGALVGSIYPYDMFKGYLHSKNLKWSFGSMKGRENDNFLIAASTSDIPRMLKKIMKVNFNGIYINREGYPDKGDVLESRLNQILNSNTIVSANSKIAFFDLRKFKPENKFVTEFNSENKFIINFNTTGNSGAYLNLAQWHSSEGEFKWTAGKTATILLDSIASNQDLILKSELFPFLGNGNIKSQKIILKFNNVNLGEWEIDQPGIYTIKLPKIAFENRSENVLQLIIPNAASPKSFGISEDIRTLAVGFKTLTIEK